MNHNEIVDTLRNNVCEVIFTKVDGTERTMKCTLKSSYLPEDFRPHTGSVLTEGDGNQERVSVWDLEANAWRGFRVDSVKTVKTLGAVNPNPLVAF